MFSSTKLYKRHWMEIFCIFSGYMFKGWNSKNLWSTRYYELKSVAVAGLFSIQHIPCSVFVFVFFISYLLHFIKKNTSVVQFQLMEGISTLIYCYICKDINEMNNREGHCEYSKLKKIPCFLEFNDCFTMHHVIKLWNCTAL